MHVYGGEPDFYVTENTNGTLPVYLNQFAYFSTESNESEELVITKDMRAKRNMTTGSWFICVHGRWWSSYKLSVSNKGTDNRWLSSGLAENGYIAENKTINYFYREDILKQKANITF